MRKLRAATSWAALVMALVLFGFAPQIVYAQTSTGSSDVQSILNAINGQPSAPQTSSTAQVPSSTTMPSQTTLAPVAPPATPAVKQPPSTVEQLFSQRAGRTLTQFGYDTFGVGASVPVTQIGAVQDNYILGPGDQINLTIRGHENEAYSVTVDRDGRIILPELSPITAGGRTFGEVRADLTRMVAKQMINSQAYISLGTVRQIGVLVTGQVASPGVRTLTGLNTPIDALLLSGGILKSGSLRDVILVRGKHRTRIDLYAILATGAYASVGALTEGDRIIVPPLGQTVAITGTVQLPGIFELAPGATAITEESLVSLAGGSALAGAKRLTKLELLPDGRTQMVDVGHGGIVRSGEVLFVDFQRSAQTSLITLAGEVSVPGTRALGSTPTMSHLIRDSDDLTQQSYTLYSVVIRRDPKSNMQAVIPFSIERTFAGKEDLQLQDSDEVYVFNQSQAAALAAAADAALVGTTSASQNPLSIYRPPVPTSNSSSGSGNSNGSSSSTGSGGSSTSTQGSSGSPSSQSTSSSPTSSSAPGGSLPQAPTQLPGGTPTGTASPSGSLSSAAPVLGTASAFQAGNVPAQNVAAPPTAPPSSASSVVNVAQAQSTQSAMGGAAATVATNNPNQSTVSLDAIAASLGIPTVELVNAARDYVVSVNGEVRNPGSYLAVGDTSLSSLVAAAGGLQREADLSSVEITSTLIDANAGTSRTVRNDLHLMPQDFASVSLKPFDSVRVRPVFSDRNGETVTILGQVRYPGTFDITRGERFSSVLARAGGLTDEAYPFGTVFTRQSAAIEEADGNQRNAKLLEDNIATVASLPLTLVNASGLVYVEQIVSELKTMPTLGRISVTADPVVLATKPELDMLMETGDVVYVPKRPSTVTVTGAVLNSGSFAYKPGLAVGDYISLAGGENGAADDSLTFVVLPDGSARPEGASWFSFGPGHEIPPGSMIVVPRDPQPFNWMEFSLNLSDIVSKLATTAAALAIIGSNGG